jgi:hypothetical protein
MNLANGAAGPHSANATTMDPTTLNAPKPAFVCKLCQKKCRTEQAYERHFKACAMAMRPAKKDDYQPTYAELFLLVQGLQDEVFRLRQKMDTVERRLATKTAKVNILDWLRQHCTPTSPETFRTWLVSLRWTVSHFEYLMDGHSVPETLLYVLRSQPAAEGHLPVISFSQKTSLYVRDKAKAAKVADAANARPKDRVVIDVDADEEEEDGEGEDGDGDGEGEDGEGEDGDGECEDGREAVSAAQPALEWREITAEDMIWVCYHLQMGLQGVGLLEWKPLNEQVYGQQGTVFVQFQKAIQKLASLPAEPGPMTGVLHQLQQVLYQWAKTELQTTSLTLV